MLADALFASSGVESRALAIEPEASGEADGGAWAVSEVEPPMTRITAGQSQMAKGQRRGIMLCYEQYVHLRHRLVGGELRRRGSESLLRSGLLVGAGAAGVGLQICD